MSYVTENTAWLSSDISQETKKLLARFYELADSKSPDAGPLMASEVFEEDAVLISPAGTFKSSEEISKSRAGAWAVVTKRRHVINAVFAGNDRAQSLILLGTVNMEFGNEKASESRFCCHVKLSTSQLDDPKPRICFMEIYASTAPASPSTVEK